MQLALVHVLVTGNFLVGDFARFGDFEVIPLATEKNSDPFFARFCSQMEFRGTPTFASSAAKKTTVGTVCRQIATAKRIPPRRPRSRVACCRHLLQPGQPRHQVPWSNPADPMPSCHQGGMSGAAHRPHRHRTRVLLFVCHFFTKLYGGRRPCRQKQLFF